MSWEGYKQAICANKHWATVNVDEDTCITCDAPFVWQNIVDDTNCDEYGLIFDRDLIERREETSVCNLGHPHTTRHAEYYVPSEALRKRLRTFQHFDTRERVFEHNPELQYTRAIAKQFIDEEKNASR